MGFVCNADLEVKYWVFGFLIEIFLFNSNGNSVEKCYVNIILLSVVIVKCVVFFFYKNIPLNCLFFFTYLSLTEGQQ